MADEGSNVSEETELTDLNTDPDPETEEEQLGIIHKFPHPVTVVSVDR